MAAAGAAGGAGTGDVAVAASARRAAGAALIPILILEITPLSRIREGLAARPQPPVPRAR